MWFYLILKYTPFWAIPTFFILFHFIKMMRFFKCWKAFGALLFLEFLLLILLAGYIYLGGPSGIYQMMENYINS